MDERYTKYAFALSLSEGSNNRQEYLAVTELEPKDRSFTMNLMIIYDKTVEVNRFSVFMDEVKSGSPGLAIIEDVKFTVIKVLEYLIDNF